MTSHLIKNMTRCGKECIQTGRGQNTQLDHIISYLEVHIGLACNLIFPIRFIICFYCLCFGGFGEKTCTHLLAAVGLKHRHNPPEMYVDSKKKKPHHIN